MVGFDHGRRLPVRAWGIRTASNALDMLADDPHETLTYQDPLYGKARFDGGIRFCCIGSNAGGYGGKHRFQGWKDITIGMDISGHTVEAMKGITASRLITNLLSQVK